MDLCEQECAGAVLMELQDEESVWAEPVDEGLLCWNWVPEGQNKRMVKDTGDKFFRKQCSYWEGKNDDEASQLLL